MLPRHQKLYLYILYILALFAVFSFLPAFAADNDPLPSTPNVPTAQAMIINIAQQVPMVMKMVTAIAYVMGFYFIFYGIMKLKQYGESRTMMSSDHSLMSPIIFLSVGTLLLYLPTSVETGLSTFWTNPSPYSYVSQGDEWGQFFNTVFLIIQLLGTIAFIRGLVILSGLGGHAQQGTLGRGLTHLIGGIFCINIYQFVQLVLSTLGIQT